jgi:glucose/mannose transport system substrate-binding protein
MPRPRRAGVAILSLTCLLVAPGCEGPAPARDTVEIIDWWVNPGEAPALAQLIGMFETQNPSQWVLNTAIDNSTEARKRVGERITAGQPPETFQANGGWDLLSWVFGSSLDDKATCMTALNQWADWAAAIPAPVLETVQVGDKIYAVPLNVHRVNTLFFNRKVFIDHDVPVPSGGTLTTLDDLFALAKLLRAEGVAAPIALGTQDPWTLSLLLFENLLVARGGGAGYRRFFEGSDDVLKSPTIKIALDDLGTLLGYTNSNAASTTWDQAIDMVRQGLSAMTIMGDWAKAYFLDQARKDGLDVDFGQITTPGTDGTFVFTTDTFGMPKGARNTDGALALLSLFGSREGQDAFSLLKGSIPARQDAGTGPYDAAALKTLAEFKAVSDDHDHLIPATAILAPPEYLSAINDALSDYSGATHHLGDVRGNPSIVLHTLENRRDMLHSPPRR